MASDVTDEETMADGNDHKNASLTKLDTNEICKEIHQLKQLIKDKDEKITQLEQHVLTLETEPLRNKKRRLENDALDQQTSDSKDDEITRLQKENEQLKRKIKGWSDMEAAESINTSGNLVMTKDLHDKDIRMQSLIEENILLKQQKKENMAYTEDSVPR